MEIISAQKSLRWHKRWLELAQLISTWSPDKSTKVGAVIINDQNEILSTGYNGLPSGFDYAEFNEENIYGRPQKYNYFEHAERNAIYLAAKKGTPLLGGILYLSWEPVVCADCARAIIQSGIKTVVGNGEIFPGHGAGVDYNLSRSVIMFRECGIQTLKIE